MITTLNVVQCVSANTDSPEATKQALEYFNRMGVIEAIFCSGWNVEHGKIIGRNKNSAPRYIIQFSDA